MLRTEQRKFLIVTGFVVAVGIAVGVFYGCSKQVEPPKSFAFDSWDTLASVANQGIDKLKEVYKPYNDTFIIQNNEDENEVQSKTREIYIEGVGNYKARVIGENHDECENGKTAALTFEFRKVTPEVPFAKSSNYSNTWESSQLRTYLNDTFFERLPKQLRDAIKSVKKDTCIGGCDQINTTIEKVFPLSATEINAQQSFNQTEGRPYTFYLINKYAPGQKSDPRNKEKKNYWLRSPLIENTMNTCSIRCDSNEKFDNEVAYDDVLSLLNVCPCFCI